MQLKGEVSHNLHFTTVKSLESISNQMQKTSKRVDLPRIVYLGHGPI